MKTRKAFVCGLLAVIFALAFVGCEQPTDSDTGVPALSGNITISPAGPVIIGAVLTASYSGTETVSYQWKKDGSEISGATATTYTANEAGSYTVTVSAPGYASKTSASVTVTLPPLTGEITITPAGPVETGTELTANYTGPETPISYQWKRGVTNVGTDSNKYTPDQSGSYTVTVSAPGYTSKTSAAVTVASYLELELKKFFGEAEDGKTYEIELSNNEEIDPQTLSSNSNITIKLIGIDEERIITISDKGSLFTVQDGVKLILGENITLKGLADNDAPLVYVESGGTLEMEEGAKITGNTNTASNSGGGVYVDGDGTFTMKGGEISGNTTTTYSSGGGVSVVGGYDSGSAIFTMEGGEISDNNASQDGGGVYVGNNGTFTLLEDGKITGNTAGNGGGVYVFLGTFTMEGGEISDNTANYSGGVSVTFGTFTMEGGEISDNTANYSGGGVSVDSNGTFTLEDGKISGNSAAYSSGEYGGGNGGGVSVGSSGTFLMKGGEITGNTADRGEYAGPYVSGFGGGVYVGGDGIFTMNDGEISDNTANFGGGVYVRGDWGVAGTFTMEGGEISDNEAINNTGSCFGGGVYVDAYGTFTIEDGKITGNTVTNENSNSFGGGVYVSGDSSSFTMKGGEISDNNANSSGGVQVWSGGTVTMKDGKISDNTGVGVNVMQNGTFIMEDGEISGNSVGGVEVSAGLFIMQGGEISGNTRATGGGVYLGYSARFYIVTGTIYGSDATDPNLANIATGTEGGEVAALFVYETVNQPATAKYGPGPDDRYGDWSDATDLPSTDTTIKVTDGVLVP